MELINLAIRTIFVDNMVLMLFLGMCSYLACAQNLKTANGLGLAVIFVLTITVPLNWVIFEFILKPDALSWLGVAKGTSLAFLVFVCFIATIAATVQLVEMLMERFIPALYQSLGIFLPLIAVNCAILGGSLFMQERGYTFPEAATFGFSAGIGWWLAILIMAAIQERLKDATIPKGLKGFPINMIITGLIAMTFMAFSGLSF